MTLIGFDPTTPEQRENPYDVLQLARREQPVFYAPASDLWVVTRHADVLTVLRDHRTFSSRGALKSTSLPMPPEVQAVLDEGYPEMPYIIEIDPPLHDRIRGLVTKAFTPRRIAQLAPRVEEIAAEILDEIAPLGKADIVERFAWPLPLRVLGELFGIPRADLEQLHDWGHDWLMLQQELPLDRRLAHARGVVAFQRYLVRAVEARIEAPTDDLIGAMVAARGAFTPPLSIVEVAGVPLDIMVAGHVTVTRAIGSALNRMFGYPPLRDHLLDSDAAPKVIEEILRLEAPAQGLFRVTTREAELGGATLPAGARVMAHFASANRDECVFAHAEEYDAEREDLSQHLAFGKGIHFCIGAPLGRLELLIGLPMLLRRLPGLRPAPEPAQREEVFFARGFRTFPVEWDA
jgi:cytochrome P450